MTALGCPPLYLPQKTTSKPNGKEPHLSIYCTPCDILKEKKDIIVIINNGGTDLGVWSYRHLLRSGGIEGGSCVSLAKALKAGTSGFSRFSAATADEPGLVILNPGQLLYSHAKHTAQTHTSWLAQRRPSAVHPPTRIHPKHNTIPGHATPEEHVAAVFAAVLRSRAFVSDSARLYVVGVADGARCALDALGAPAAAPLLPRVAAIALIQPTHAADAVASPALRELLAARGRAFVLSSAPRGTLLDAPWAERKPNEWGYVQRVDCPVYASGVADFAESIFGMEAGRAMVMDWFGEVKWVDSGMKAPANLWGVLETPGCHFQGYENEKFEVKAWEDDTAKIQGGIEESGGMEYGQDAEEDSGNAMGDSVAAHVSDGDTKQTAQTGMSNVEAVAVDSNKGGLTEQARGAEEAVQPNPGHEKVRIANTEVDKDLLVRAGLL